MSWLSLQFRKNPLQNLILCIIVAIHFIFLLILLISPTFVFRKKEHKALIVKTIAIKPPVKAAAVEKKSASPRAATPIQKAAAPPVKKEITKPQPPSKKEAPMPKATAALKPAPASKKEPAIADKQLSKPKQTPPVKKNPAQQNRAKISDSLLKELEESIAKMDNKKSVSKPISASKALAPVPLQIDLLTPDSSELEEEASDYTARLIAHLHQALQLPDYGEVKIQLSLRQDGSVVRRVRRGDHHRRQGLVRQEGSESHPRRLRRMK